MGALSDFQLLHWSMCRSFEERGCLSKLLWRLTLCRFELVKNKDGSRTGMTAVTNCSPCLVNFCRCCPIADHVVRSLNAMVHVSHVSQTLCCAAIVILLWGGIMFTTEPQQMNSVRDRFVCSYTWRVSNRFSVVGACMWFRSDAEYHFRLVCRYILGWLCVQGNIFLGTMQRYERKVPV